MRAAMMPRLERLTNPVTTKAIHERTGETLLLAALRSDATAMRKAIGGAKKRTKKAPSASGSNEIDEADPVLSWPAGLGPCPGGREPSPGDGEPSPRGRAPGPGGRLRPMARVGGGGGAAKDALGAVVLAAAVRRAPDRGAVGGGAERRV